MAIYYPASLQDIAKMFDRMADQDEKAARRSVSQGERRRAEAYAAATRACAAILRDCELVTTEKETTT